MLSGVATLLLTPEAARIQRKREGTVAKSAPHLASHDAKNGDVIAFDGCAIPSLVFGGVRSALNNVWAGLEQYDPAILDIEGKRSFSIIGCGIELDAKANISLAGFSEGGIRNLACNNAVCLQRAADGSCANTEYSFSAHLAVGDCKDTLQVAGGVDADWGLCGRDIPRMVVDAAFDLVGPGVKVDLAVEHSGGVNAKVSKINTLDLSWGVPTNYKCGFELQGIPGFIGDIVSDYCVSLMDWLADKIQGRLNDDAEKLVREMLNKQLDL